MEKVVTWRAITERLAREEVLTIDLTDLVTLTVEELRERGFERTEKWVKVRNE